jgi:hypothetical protein
MDVANTEEIFQSGRQAVSRRTVIGRMVIGGAGAALVAGGSPTVRAQEATPAAGECVATAPPFDESGIAFAPLVSGVVRGMPPGPIEVRISRLAMAPGTVIEASASPHPALMYIETGTTACPGAAGRIVYAPDGAIVEESKEEGVQYTPAGSMQYIPAGIPDGAGNEETELMSSLIIEFVPVQQSATPVP